MAADPSDPRTLDEQFSRLWENDRRTQRERLAVIARAMLNGDASTRIEAGREAHALAGVAAMYGFAKAAGLARKLEQIFDAAAPLPSDTGMLVSELAAALEEPYQPRG